MNKIVCSHLAWVLVVFVLSTKHVVAQEKVSQIRGSFEVAQAFGESGSDYFFGAPIAIATDSKGQVYVADRMSAEIKVLTPQGDLSHTIGEGRGRGPGEFHSIGAIALDEQDQILVVDPMQRRLTRFAHSGAVIATFQSTDLGVEAPVVSVGPEVDGEDTYVFLERHNPLASPDGHLFQVYDEDLKDRVAQFGPYALEGVRETFARIHSTIHPGSFVVCENGDILFAPGIYQGVIYRFARTASGWGEAQPLAGHVEEGEPFVTVDPDGVDTEDYVRVQSIDNTWAGRAQQVSAGLFEMGTGEVVHFTYYNREGENAYLAMELFNAKGELAGYGPVATGLRSFPFPSTLNPVWKDEADRFYLIDTNSEPVVRIARLTYQMREQE